MESFSRRTFLRNSILLSASGIARTGMGESRSSKKLHVVVIGAGAFGGWTALHLLRGGAQVTLLDAWGPGNSRASSGGETRVIRAVYGATQMYVRWAVRSWKLWLEHEERWGRRLLRPTGALWFLYENDEYVTHSLPFIKEEGLDYERLTVEEAARRFPQIQLDGVKWVFLEKTAGFLLARQACQAVVQGFVEEGGEYKVAQASPGPISAGSMESLVLQDGSKKQADLYVFACGPWLSGMFPGLQKDLIVPTRQEVFFFGVPAGDLRFTDARLPVWVDFGERLIYGIPGNESRGFKIADDTHGERFDPTSGHRVVSQQGIEAARKFVARRFPGLKDAPLVETRVCQYENSPDGHFIIDRHPEAANVWIVGGGSGHGFKHCPALGEYVSSLIRREATPDPLFSLSRFRV